MQSLTRLLLKPCGYYAAVCCSVPYEMAVGGGRRLQRISVVFLDVKCATETESHCENAGDRAEAPEMTGKSCVRVAPTAVDFCVAMEQVDVPFCSCDSIYQASLWLRNRDFRKGTTRKQSEARPAFLVFLFL